MLRSLKLKLFGPKVRPWNSGFDVGKSRFHPKLGSGGGCMAARGDDISIVALEYPVKDRGPVVVRVTCVDNECARLLDSSAGVEAATARRYKRNRTKHTGQES